MCAKPYVAILNRGKSSKREDSNPQYIPRKPPPTVEAAVEVDRSENLVDCSVWISHCPADVISQVFDIAAERRVVQDPPAFETRLGSKKSNPATRQTVGPRNRGDAIG